MKLVLVLYINGIRTDKEIDFHDASTVRTSVQDFQMDPRSEWAEQNGTSQDHDELLKLNIEDIPHEWKIETQSERGDPIPEGWGYND